jgi:hypothetical protein
VPGLSWTSQALVVLGFMTSLGIAIQFSDENIIIIPDTALSTKFPYFAWPKNRNRRQTRTCEKKKTLFS